MVPTICLWSAAVLAASITGASPANDWNKPCFNGECAYEIPQSAGVSGIIKLMGSPRSITDITPAAGWVILDCEPNTLIQDIRLVCKSDNVEAACGHLFAHHGAVDKIVRLPESCGHGPFARIASVKVADDQSLPTHVNGIITRRDGIPPVVHLLSIDTNYEAVDISQTGRVRFAFQGVNQPGFNANFEYTEAFWDDAWNWMKGAANKVADGVVSAAKTVANAAKDVWEAVKSVPGIVHNATHFNMSTEIVPKKQFAFDTNGQKNLLNINKPECGAVGGSLKVDLSGKGSATVTLLVIAEGYVVPPTISKFAAVADISADVEGKLDVHASIFGGIDSHRREILSFGIPGLTINGLFKLGPYLVLEMEGRAYFELDLVAEATLSFHVDHMQIWFPSRDHKTTEKSISANNIPIKLSAAANLQAYGVVEGHLIPAVKFGVEVGKGAAKANALVEADVFVRLNVQAEANAKYSHKRNLDGPEVGGQVEYSPPYGSYGRELNTRGAHGSSASFSGCVWVECGVVVSAGVEGNLFNAFKAEAKKPLYTSPAPTLLEKCFAIGKEVPNKHREMKHIDLEKYFKEKTQCRKNKAQPLLITQGAVSGKKL